MSALSPAELALTLKYKLLVAKRKEDALKGISSHAAAKPAAMQAAGRPGAKKQVPGLPSFLDPLQGSVLPVPARQPPQLEARVAPPEPRYHAPQPAAQPVPVPAPTPQQLGASGAAEGGGGAAAVPQLSARERAIRALLQRKSDPNAPPTAPVASYVPAQAAPVPSAPEAPARKLPSAGGRKLPSTAMHRARQQQQQQQETPLDGDGPAYHELQPQPQQQLPAYLAAFVAGPSSAQQSRGPPPPSFRGGGPPAPNFGRPAAGPPPPSFAPARPPAAASAGTKRPAVDYGDVAGDAPADKRPRKGPPLPPFAPVPPSPAPPPPEALDEDDDDDDDGRASEQHELLAGPPMQQQQQWPTLQHQARGDWVPGQLEGRPPSPPLPPLPPPCAPPLPDCIDSEAAAAPCPPPTHSCMPLPPALANGSIPVISNQAAQQQQQQQVQSTRGPPSPAPVCSPRLIGRHKPIVFRFAVSAGSGGQQQQQEQQQQQQHEAQQPTPQPVPQMQQQQQPASQQQQQQQQQQLPLLPLQQETLRSSQTPLNAGSCQAQPQAGAACQDAVLVAQCGLAAGGAQVPGQQAACTVPSASPHPSPPTRSAPPEGSRQQHASVSNSKAAGTCSASEAACQRPAPPQQASSGEEALAATSLQTNASARCTRNDAPMPGPAPRARSRSPARHSPRTAGGVRRRSYSPSRSTDPIPRSSQRSARHRSRSWSQSPSRSQSPSPGRRRRRGRSPPGRQLPPGYGQGYASASRSRSRSRGRSYWRERSRQRPTLRSWSRDQGDRGRGNSPGRSSDREMERPRSPVQQRQQGRGGSAGHGGSHASGSGRGAADRDTSEGCTLFVGDLPEGLEAGELQAVFEELAPVVRARIMRGKCFGFVTFEDPLETELVLSRVGVTPVYTRGVKLRVARAQGELEAWKRGPAPPSKPQQQAQQHGDQWHGSSDSGNGQPRGGLRLVPLSPGALRPYGSMSYMQQAQRPSSSSGVGTCGFGARSGLPVQAVPLSALLSMAQQQQQARHVLSYDDL